MRESAHTNLDFDIHKIKSYKGEYIYIYIHIIRMATMVARGSSPLPSMSIPEKGSRNKRKFRADPPAADPADLAHPFQSECPNYDLFPADRTPESFNLEHLASVCDMCKTLMCGPKGDGVEPEDPHDADWSDLTETQLKEILLSNLDAFFKNAIAIVSAYGYTEEAAVNAVLSAGLRYDCRDALSAVVDTAFEWFRGGQEIDTSKRENLSEDLQKLENSVLSRMVSVLREAHPFFSIGDAMWCLLICDLNVSHACSMDGNPSKCIGNEEKLDACSNSDNTASLALPESGVSQNVPQPETPTLPSMPNLAYGRFSAPGNAQSMIPNLKISRNPVTSSDHVEESSSLSLTQTLQEEKAVSSKMVQIGSSKKESSILQQKSIHLEKSYRALGSKAALKACKHSGVGTTILDRRCKSISGNSGMSLKSSLKVGKVMGMNITEANATLNLSFSAGLSSTSSFNTKAANSHPQTATANTELSLSLPSSSSSVASTKQDCGVEASKCCNFDAYPYDKICKDWVAEHKKDEIAISLVPYVRELQTQMQSWTDWAQQKVMQAARRLAKEKDELQSLRQEKEEAGRMQEERQSLEESTRKKLAEMETAIAKASGQVERANATARRLEVENAQLRLEMEAAKLQAAESAANCEELSRKEVKTVKKAQSWETQRTLLQEELVNEKHKLSHLQQQLEQGKSIEINCRSGGSKKRR
uniref:PIR2-like helical domain-containing protein n=1 Tax=Ananas comosus var. bracteatus TaxID=296719 RepID=A0A6V7PFL5_ANACO|nr:unnamed protein product [Ananas comosus var. bracteatus]